MGVIGGLEGAGAGAGALVHTIEEATVTMEILAIVETTGIVDAGAAIAMGSMIAMGEGGGTGARGERKAQLGKGARKGGLGLSSGIEKERKGIDEFRLIFSQSTILVYPIQESCLAFRFWCFVILTFRRT